MRSLERNKQTVYYALFLKNKDVTDQYGNKTGEYEPVYTDPIELKINVSPAKGSVYHRQFGDSVEYDKVLATTNTNLPITESSVFWIDSLKTKGPHDYTVTRVGRSLNSVSYAVKRVNLG